MNHTVWLFIVTLAWILQNTPLHSKDYYNLKMLQQERDILVDICNREDHPAALRYFNSLSSSLATLSCEGEEALIYAYKSLFLGLMHLSGIGAPLDYRKALEHCNTALTTHIDPSTMEEIWYTELHGAIHSSIGFALTLSMESAATQEEENFACLTAISHFEQAIQYTPKNPDNFFMLGALYVEKNTNPENCKIARHYFNKALELEPNDKEALEFLNHITNYEKRQDVQMLRIKKLHDKFLNHPLCARCAYKLGKAYNNHSDYTNAKIYFSRALQLDESLLEKIIPKILRIKDRERR